MATTCLYGGVAYSPGSIVCQAGRKKECLSTGQWSDLGTCDATDVPNADVDAQFRIEFPTSHVKDLTDAELRVFVSGELFEAIAGGLRVARDMVAQATAVDRSMAAFGSDQSRPSGSGGGAGGSGSNSTTVSVGASVPVGNGGTLSVTGTVTTGGGSTQSDLRITLVIK